MAESPDHNSNDGGTRQAADSVTSGSAAFICLKTIPQRSYARDLRLREGDVIAAVNGVAYTADIEVFEKLLFDAGDKETSAFVTIARDQMLFEIFIDGPLGAKFDYTNSQRANEISESLTGYQVGPLEQYQTYEALRNLHRHVSIYNTTYSSLATICPPLWLMQHRALEPLAAVIAAYAAAAAVHWAALIVTIFLVGVYFHRIQYKIIRNYNLFTEHYYWAVCAARSMADAQKICREMDPKCTFSFSYVGPPQENES